MSDLIDQLNAVLTGRYTLQRELGHGGMATVFLADDLEAPPPVEIGEIPYPAGMSAVRWFLADAFEKLGQPDSAVVYLERAVSAPASASGQDSHLYGIASPFAHRRLVLLYARMGRIEEARQHWKTFLETVRTPDPVLQPLIDEARTALAGAEAMAKSMKR